MASNEVNRVRLDSETWRRIGAVLDRIIDVDVRAQPQLLADACRAEGVRVEDVEPFIAAADRSDAFLERLDDGVVEEAFRGFAGELPPTRLTAGNRLGPYEIVGRIGAGGMGEVYKARDTRLDRTVALKLVATELAEHSEGRLRFEREARAISALNHPHVCTLYDVSHQDGIDFLVMELIDGETLAARLRRGALSPEEVLRHATQIADALATAHRHGIVHRDLKPANIMLTPRGVKLLDFGLAAWRAPRAAVEGVTNPTVTVEGKLLGTLSYMAPEQLQGKTADARADIFALGAVIYEMLTARRAFDAESPAGVIAAVLEREPEPLSKVRSDVPPALDAAMRTCLAKPTDDRWQTAADLARHLQWIERSPGVAERLRPDGWSRRTALGWIATAALFTAIAVGGLTQTMWPESAPPGQQPSVTRFTLDPPEQHSYDRMHALSPDGSRVAFAAAGKSARALWTRALDALTPQRLAGTEGATYPFWSPDGRFIGFFADNALKKIEIATGTIETICKCETGLGGGATWNQDGVILFSKGLVVSPLWRVSAAGGVPVAVTSDPGPAIGPPGGINAWPQFLPDGLHFLWMVGRAGGDPGLYVGRLGSTDRKRLLEFPRLRQDLPTRGWYSSGYLFFVRQNALIAQAFSLEKFELLGDPIRVVESVEQTAPGRSFFAVAPGVLTYRPRREAAMTVRLAWFDRSGREIAPLGEPMAFGAVALSPDERYVLANAAPSGLVRIDVASGIPTPAGWRGQSPVWAPDGKRFAVAGGGLEAPIPAIGSFASNAAPKALGVTPTGQAWPTDWSRDGRYIVGQVLHADTALDIWAAEIAETNATTRYLIRAPGNQQDQRISPDGRWVAYASDERSEPFEVYVRRFPEGPGIWRVSTAGGRLPSWTSDGRELLYVSPDGTLMRAAVTTDHEFSVGVPQPLFRHDALDRAFGRDQQFGRLYDVADGRRILIGVPVSDPPPAPIVVVLNWERLVDTAAR